MQRICCLNSQDVATWVSQWRWVLDISGLNVVKYGNAFGTVTSSQTFVCLSRAIWSRNACYQYLWFIIPIHCSFYASSLVTVWIINHSPLRDTDEMLVLTFFAFRISFTVDLLYFQMQSYLLAVRFVNWNVRKFLPSYNNSINDSYKHIFCKHLLLNCTELSLFDLMHGFNRFN